MEANSSFEEFKCKLSSDIPTSKDLFFTFSGELAFDSWNMFYEDPANDELVESGVASLAVEPNPAKNVVTVSGLTAGDIVTVTTASGVVVKTFVAEADVAQIYVSDLSTGVYFVSNGLKTVKMIKY